MSFARGDRGGGRGGGGLLFGTGTSIFADNAARDLYFANNVGQLEQYNLNEFLLIQVGTGFQRRRNDAWIVVTHVVTGARGERGPAASDVEILHDANVADPIPNLYAIPGAKTATTATDTDAVKALTAGVFTVDGVSTAPIDFSGVSDSTSGLTPIVNLMTEAIANVPALDGYAVSLGFVNPQFFFLVRNFNGDVGVLSGDVVTAMGLDTVTQEMFTAGSSPITIAPPATGYWRELRFFSTMEMRRASQYCTFRSTYLSDGMDTHSWLDALSNTGAWFQETNSNESSGLYTIGKATTYSSVFSDFKYNVATGEITWDNKFNAIPGGVEIYKMNSLLVIGIRGS